MDGYDGEFWTLILCMASHVVTCNLVTFCLRKILALDSVWCSPQYPWCALEVAMLNLAAGTRHAAVMQPLQPRAQPVHCRENRKYLVKGENICI